MIINLSHLATACKLTQRYSKSQKSNTCCDWVLNFFHVLTTLAAAITAPIEVRNKYLDLSKI
ncbi:hypothetical protein NSP_16970 [Nodularia spumigena CCY9414]|nr:hypothetical protein NSP_16970 [Nodularia spumigena CCY9414]